MISETMSRMPTAGVVIVVVVVVVVVGDDGADVTVDPVKTPPQAPQAVLPFPENRGA